MFTGSNFPLQGSKNYTYTGVLDKLASRAYAATNAWTAVDHTAYTLETAGWEGFAQIVRFNSDEASPICVLTFPATSIP